MSVIIGNGIVILAVAGLLAVCAREIWKEHKSGGCGGCTGCTGCSKGCKGCSGSCSSCHM